MEDEQIKDLFRNFAPGISPDNQFLAQLQRNMDAVDLVKRHNHAAQKCYKTAMLIAAAAGFAAGIAFMLLLPTIVSWLSTIKLSLPILGLQALTPDWQVIGWLVAAFLSATTAINAYEIAITRLQPHKEMS